MRKITSILCLAVAVLVVKAQDEPKPDRDLISLLTRKNVITTQEADSITPAVKFKPSVEAHVMAHVAYRYADNASPNNTFSLERAFLYANAYLTPKIDMFALYYVTPSVLNMVHEFWGRWRICQQFGARVGLMKVPITIENLVPTPLLHTVDFSQTICSLAGAIDDVIGTNVGRDLGVEVFGDLVPRNGYSLLSYNLGIFNGTGISKLRDNNSAKDVAAMLSVRPLKDWKVEASAVWGCATYELLRDNIAMGDHVRNRYNFGTVYDSKKFYGRTEYTYGRDAQMDRHGFYALGIYKATPKLDLTLVYDWYNRDMETSDNISVKYKVGFTYRFTSLCRVQTFYTYWDKPNLSERANDFIAQLQLGF